jgi:adenosylhomocysteine nucleosidase
VRLAAFFLFFSSLCGAEKVDLLVQGALDIELQPLLGALQDKREINLAAWTFWTGKIGGKSVVISRTEVGPINAAAATALGIQRFHPASIINQGTAGAHDSQLGLWDIVVGAYTTDYGSFQSAHADRGAGVDTARWTPLTHKLRIDNKTLSDFRSFPGDARLLAIALGVPYSRGKVVKGNIGSAYQLNRELDHIEWLHRVYGTDSEDMESAFSAGVAAGMKTPFLAVRIISDSEWSHPKFERTAGEYCAAFVVDLIRTLK